MRYFVFIRAINTGKRRLTNDEMLSPLRALGFDDAAAYQAAGNFTFTSSTQTSALEMETSIRSAMESAFGFEAPTFVRTDDELRTVAAAAPFTEVELAKTAGKVQVTFMSSPPTDEQVAEAESLVPAEDLVRLDGREWFWLPVEGISGSTLSVTGIESIVGPMTMRTLGTVERMLSKFGS